MSTYSNLNLLTYLHTYMIILVERCINVMNAVNFLILFILIETFPNSKIIKNSHYSSNLSKTCSHTCETPVNLLPNRSNTNVMCYPDRLSCCSEIFEFAILLKIESSFKYKWILRK